MTRTERRTQQAGERRRRNPEKNRIACREWRKKYPGRNKASQRKHHTGWTADEYVAAHTAQRGMCAICGTPPRGVLNADHDHATKKKRGLLCHECNAGLGMFYDSPWILQQAIAYLKRFA